VISGLGAIRSHGNRDEELYLTSDGSAVEESFMTDRIVTPEEGVRFIKAVEVLVRTSREYKAYQSYLRNDLGMNRCSVLSNVDTTTDEVGLEFHHCPLNLYEVVDLVLSHRLRRGQAVTSLTVADEVLAAHMMNMVGLVPLLASLHKLAHAGSLVIHPAQVHGNWLALLRAYPDGVTEVLVERLMRFCTITEVEVMASAEKLRPGARPRLRTDGAPPRPEEVELLLMGPGR
jgi:hypothetical protein